jgi:hypothetical protein
MIDARAWYRAAARRLGNSDVGGRRISSFPYNEES